MQCWQGFDASGPQKRWSAQSSVRLNRKALSKYAAQGTVRTNFLWTISFLQTLTHYQPAMQTTFQFYNPESEVIVTQGHLPHWDQAGATTFITWRTADSIPKHVWEQWRTARNQWLRDHHIDPSNADWRRSVELLPPPDRHDFRKFSKQLEEEIDRGHGACVLRDQALSGIVAEALKHFDGERYLLGDFVIMPNHVHLLVGRMARATMLLQVESWKKWTAIQINKALGQKGRFWQDENYDHLVRDETAFNRFRKYIAANPTDAGLTEGNFCYWKRPELHLVENAS